MYSWWYNRQRLYIFIAGCIALLFLSNLPSYSQQPHFHKPLHKPLHKLPPEPPISPENSPSSKNPHPQSLPAACAGYPSTANLIVVIKTGASEINTKLPIQLLTFLQCVSKDNILIFSDMEQQLGGHHIYDALDEVALKARKDNPDFDLYDDQQAYRAEGEYVYSIRDRSAAAWSLDKYKNIHTAQKAWRQRPDRSWYLFIDADTYVFWSSLFALLARYDADEKWYLGSRVDDGRPPFAHGGSGYLLSRGAMMELVGKDEKEIALRYDLEAVGACCGDQELARTLSYRGINVTNLRPIIQGNEPNRISFGPEEWCQALITMHHIIGEAMNDMWQFELRRENPKDILTLKSYYAAYMEPQILSYRHEWDNEAADIILTRETPTADSSDSTKKRSSWWTWSQPYQSFNLCAKACKQDPECYMFNHHGETCSLARSWKLGRKRVSENEEVWDSGWNLERIEKFRKEMGMGGVDVCEGKIWTPAT